MFKKDRLGDLHLVFNDIKDGSGAYGYGYGYGYGYDYGVNTYNSDYFEEKVN